MTPLDRLTPSERFLAGLAEKTAPVVFSSAAPAPHQWRWLLDQARELDGAASSAWDPQPGLDALRRALGATQADRSVPRPRGNLSGLAPI